MDTKVTSHVLRARTAEPATRRWQICLRALVRQASRGCRASRRTLHHHHHRRRRRRRRRRHKKPHVVRAQPVPQASAQVVLRAPGNLTAAVRLVPPAHLTQPQRLLPPRPRLRAHVRQVSNKIRRRRVFSACLQAATPTRARTVENAPRLALSTRVPARPASLETIVRRTRASQIRARTAVPARVIRRLANRLVNAKGDTAAPPARMLHVRQEAVEFRASVNHATKVHGRTRQELRHVKRAQVHTSPQRLLAPNLSRNVYA